MKGLDGKSVFLEELPSSKKKKVAVIFLMQLVFLQLTKDTQNSNIIFRVEINLFL